MSRRLPTGYLESLLPSVEDMIGESGKRREEEKARSRPKMRKVHFYIDHEDHERLLRIVEKIAEEQGVLADRRGITSKVLRAAVRLGLREIEEKVTHG